MRFNKKEYNKNYYEKNRETISEFYKEYYEKNKEILKEKRNAEKNKSLKNYKFKSEVVSFKN